MVDSSINWSSSYGCSWRLMEVDTSTWASSKEFGGVTAASVERDAYSDLLESGNVTADTDEPREMWGRFELLATQGNVERHAVATLLLVPTSSRASAGRLSAGYDGYSVLKPAADRMMLAGAYVPAGADAAAWCADSIGRCTPAPTVVDGAFSLSEPMVFAGGTSVLDAVWQVLDAAGWCIQIDGDGTVHVREMPNGRTMELDGALIGTEVEVGDVANDSPNRYVAVEGAKVAIATDDDPSSPTSTVSRNGRIVEVYDGAPARLGGETLEMYAQRKLAERNRSAGTRSYRRAWVPGVTVFDVVGNGPEGSRLGDDMRITRQSIEMGAGARVSEECEVLRWA